MIASTPEMGRQQIPHHRLQLQTTHGPLALVSEPRGKSVNEQARQLMGWYAKTPLVEGIKKTVDWWRVLAGAFVALFVDLEPLFSCFAL